MKTAIGKLAFAGPILVGTAFALLSASAAAQPNVRRDAVVQPLVEIPLMDGSGTVRAIMVFREGDGRRTITFLDPARNPINEIATAQPPAGIPGPPIPEVGRMRGIAVSPEEGRVDPSLRLLQNQIDALNRRVDDLNRRVRGPR